MSRRARAVAFALAALACAALAAAAVEGYRDRATVQYGELRTVVVAQRPLAAGRPLDPETLELGLAVRRVPESFVPPGALGDPGLALGRAPAAPIAAGSYVLDSLLVVPEPRRRPRPQVGTGLRPVQIAVQGADALRVAGVAEGARVDVVVTAEPRGAGRGRTYVAAPGVRLLALAGPGAAGEPGTARATLALRRDQALELIAAESFARSIRLLPRGGG